MCWLQSGRFAVAVGPAGAGKTTLLRPLVEAWSSAWRRGRGSSRCTGTALAWRQSDLLADAGIAHENTMAIAALLTRAGNDRLTLDRNSVVVVDELSQIGTAQALALLRLQERSGFAIVAIGDDRQGQAIEAGNIITLLRRAFGTGGRTQSWKAPCVRSASGIARRHLLFRQGNAAEGYRATARGQARRAGARRPPRIHRRRRRSLGSAIKAPTKAALATRLTVSAPTNADARDISAAIRERRRRGRMRTRRRRSYAPGHGPERLPNSNCPSP